MQEKTRGAYLSRVISSIVAASSLAVAADVTRAASPSVSTTGNVAGWLKNATPVGTASTDQSVTLSLHVGLRNAAQLQRFVGEVSNPASKAYGRYLSAQEFASAYAPAASDVAAVVALLEKSGMKDVQVGPDGVFVSATATVAQIRSTFKVTQDLYSYRGKTLRANRENPTIPAALAGKLVYIAGLDDSGVLRKPMHKVLNEARLVAPTTTAVSASAATPPPVAASNPSPYCNTYYGSGTLKATLSTAADVYGAEIPWLNCGYTPQQIRESYGANQVQYDGTGVTVAIVDAYASPTLWHDANRYSAKHDLPYLNKGPGKNFNEIIPPGIFNVSPTEACIPYGWWGEESLDVDAVHGMAPGANIVYIGSRDCGPSLDDALITAVYKHTADIVTNSWGYDGETVAPGEVDALDQAFMAGAAQGVTVLVSSGDDGDVSQVNGLAAGDWPATSPYVTGVGGTTIELRDQQGDKYEYGWGNYRAFLDDVTVKSATSVATSGLATTTAFGFTFDDFSFYSGSGGGISLLEKQPAYQAGTVPANLATTLNLGNGETEALQTKQRVSPDVALMADPYTGYLVGETFTIAGNKFADSGCTALSKTEEYCEIGYGGTSVASPLMAGVFAIMNQRRHAKGEPAIGFANPLLYKLGSHGSGFQLNTAPLNQIIAPREPVSLLRGYAANLNEARVVTVNSVPFLVDTAPFGIFACALKICYGVDDVFNYTSVSSSAVPPTPSGYNDVTGLGVPYVPLLIEQ